MDEIEQKPELRKEIAEQIAGSERRSRTVDQGVWYLVLINGAAATALLALLPRLLQILGPKDLGLESAKGDLIAVCFASIFLFAVGVVLAGTANFLRYKVSQYSQYHTDATGRGETKTEWKGKVDSWAPWSWFCQLAPALLFLEAVVTFIIGCALLLSGCHLLRSWLWWVALVLVVLSTMMGLWFAIHHLFLDKPDESKTGG